VSRSGKPEGPVNPKGRPAVGPTWVVFTNLIKKFKLVVVERRPVVKFWIEIFKFWKAGASLGLKSF
jgi:hypothetical protein